MMRIPRLRSLLCLTCFGLLAAGQSSATVTLLLSNTIYLSTNFADGAGAGGSSLYWGIIVDPGRDGLEANYMTAGVDYGNHGGSPGGVRPAQALRDENGNLSDDVLFMSPTTMQLITASQEGRDGAHEGQNRLNGLVSVPFLPGFAEGTPFYIVWFDRSAPTFSSPSGAPVVGEQYGILSNPALLLPPDAGTLLYSSAFAGADPLRQMTHTWAPEPSTLLLSALGAVGLVRRRR